MSRVQRGQRLITILTYLLTPWNRVLLEKLTGSQVAKEFPAFYGTRRFITAFTSARHLPLSWARSIQSMPPHPNSWSSILILSYLLRLGLTSGLFPSGFPTKTLYKPLLSPLPAARFAHFIIIDLITQRILGDGVSDWCVYFGMNCVSRNEEQSYG